MHDLAAAVADQLRLWDIPRAPGDDQRPAFTEVFTNEFVGVWVVSWHADDHDIGFHDHGRSQGAIYVARGAIRHEYLSDNRVVDEAGIAGVWFGFDENFVHRVSAERESGPAITVHVYSPPLSLMTPKDAPGVIAIERDTTEVPASCGPVSRAGAPFA